MRNLWTIIKKELRRFFTDRRMIITLLLPGLMIFLLYTLMGDVMQTNLGVSDNYTYTLYVENEPAGFKEDLKDKYKLNLEYMTELDNNSALEHVIDKTLDLYVKFPSNFDAEVAAGNQPVVEFHYNATSKTSANIFSIYTSILASEMQTYQIETNNHASDIDTSLQLITGLIPFLLITFLYSGAMAVAPESIAGEKERGTIANLLITPVKRSHIALGKIIALSIVALTSAASSFIGLMASLPKLMGSNANIDFSMYHVGTYLMLLLVITSTVLIFIILISLISTYAKSIKEAAGLATPLMILVMLVGVSTLMGSAANHWYLYLIPIYNSVNALLSIFSMNVDYLNLTLTILSNLVVTGLGIYILTLMFKSEKVMFRK